MSDYTLLILYASLALGLSFLCSILEAVLLSTTRSHIIALEDTHKKTSELWIRYKDDPERPLTAILTLNTTAHTVGALGVGYEVQKVYPEYSVAVASAILTIAILLLSEILPKTIGALYWRKLTVPSATVLRMLIFLLWIFVWTIQILRSFLPEVTTEEVTRTELAVLADIAEESHVIEEDEETVIQNLLRLREIMVSEVMTPRRVMKTVGSRLSVGDVLNDIPIMIFGRMPMIGDNIDDIRGMVLRSDILRKAADNDYSSPMEDFARDIFHCNHDDSVDKALDILLENKVQILIVKDDFGQTVGLITMEDIIETLLGVEIVDESDQEAIDDGNHHEDMRELARLQYEDSESE
ncbi:MAG: hemolysin [Euryarchaeota archaeon]|nr:hemolysin [Euryarchaeota archaeon]